MPVKAVSKPPSVTPTATVVDGVDLKPCPFCGSAAVLKKGTGVYDSNRYWAKCTDDDCRMSTRSETDPKTASEAWNRRA